MCGCGADRGIFEGGIGKEAGVEYPREYEVARRWWNLPAGTLLPLSQGGYYRLIFPGRPGGVQGPDVRDVVLYPLSAMAYDNRGQQAGITEEQIGDVEFHVRSSDWSAHKHHSDARYNHVILHIVLICDGDIPTPRQDGFAIPVCSLYDFPIAAPRAIQWPCEQTMPRLSVDARQRLLRQAGLLRFEQKAHAFVELLHSHAPNERFSVYDMCLIPALAEGLGYGRDRDFFRAVGLRLLGTAQGMPEPLGHALHPPVLDAKRLRILSQLVEQWSLGGAWQPLREKLCSLDSDKGNRHTLTTLRALFGALSSARADIVICNVVLPFALAIALIENDMLLAECAKRVYLEYPGLSSNQVTRTMCRQLQLLQEPRGACQQQGLHYIYRETCREKRCGECIVGKRDI